DQDGDLDMFLLQHTVHNPTNYEPRAKALAQRDSASADRLFRNEGGSFVDVSKAAGLNAGRLGYGLDVSVADINLDGWPDLFISNDFHENDYLYINDQHGGFSEEATLQFQHTSRFSMGVDVADINNDGWQDILTLDMLPSDRYILKSSLGEDGFDVFQFKIGHGYQHQYARNNLQLNRGNGTFSEIACLAGIYATDWSWSPQFGDFNHDGRADIFISNGIPRRMNDIDYINFQTGDENIQYKLENNLITDAELQLIQKMPEIKLINPLFINDGSLSFTDISQDLPGSRPTYSSGTVLIDLEGDGDLDIITNNIQDAPSIYLNHACTTDPAVVNHAEENYLKLTFAGPVGNRDGIGTTIKLSIGETTRKFEYYPTRGYLSSSHNGLHIGLGADKPTNAEVLWPNGQTQSVDLVLNKTQLISYRPDSIGITASMTSAPPWQEISTDVGLLFDHEENPFVEFNREPLMPFMVSREGPALAIGDVNGDGLDDIFLGSSKRRSSRLFVQDFSGHFSSWQSSLFDEDALFEDVDACIVDFDLDGDLDLFIASGGNEYRGTSEALSQRAYQNIGQGRLQRFDPFVGAYVTAAAVIPVHANADAYPDFFLAGRAVTSSYGTIPTSTLWINNQDGTFRMAQSQLPLEGQIGLVRSGRAVDFDQDGDEDILLAAEWMPPLLLTNSGAGQFELETLGDQKGWWNTLVPFDLDQDGDLDLIAGNTGLNTRLKPTNEEPLRLYVGDVDQNGQDEQLLTYFLNGHETLFPNHAEVIKQLPGLRKKFLYAKDFASAELSDLVDPSILSETTIFEVNQMESGILVNEEGSFRWSSFPKEGQFAPLHAFVPVSANDNETSWLALGNFYENNIEMGRYDASYGHLIKIGSDLSMSVSKLPGLDITGQSRRSSSITIRDQRCYVVARNDASALLLRAPQTLDRL
ncbi:MAG: VCBS repeat-containing protein, partial [Saprospiraceae bacterium]|nr:VCBS repeat-containing protein [Saprospiraceae bacterium]